MQVCLLVGAARQQETAAAGSMFAQQSPQLSSIQLLHLRARQHMANADVSSASLPAAPSHPQCQADVGSWTPQAPSGAHTDRPSRLLGSAGPQSGQPPPLRAAPNPPEHVGIESSPSAGLSQAHGSVQHVYAPAGARSGADGTLQDLLARLWHQSNSNHLLPSPAGVVSLSGCDSASMLDPTVMLPPHQAVMARHAADDSQPER